MFFIVKNQWEPYFTDNLPEHMLGVGFEHTTPVFEQEKIFHALDALSL
jgi:hypothetical protein